MVLLRRLRDSRASCLALFHSTPSRVTQAPSTLGLSRDGMMSASVRPRIGHPLWLMCGQGPHPAKGSNEGHVFCPVDGN